MKKGFTLIELLVVIAIIGILASIVLVSFPGATKKAHDSRIVSAIAQARTVMVYYYANYGDYDGFATGTEEMAVLATEVSNNGGNLIIQHAPASNSTSSCMYSAMNGAPDYYCAESGGTAGYTNIDPATTCKADNSLAKCPAYITTD